MYCKKCYTNLSNATDANECPKCRRKFDPANPRTTLRRPFPSRSKMIVQILATSALGILAAAVVALFQSAASSGH